MTTLRYEQVAPGSALFLALVRGRVRAPESSTLDEAVRAARERPLDRGPLADAVAARLESWGAATEALASAERLRHPGVVVVVTGQQPVFLGGPLLVLTKALAAVRWARRLEERGVPAVPVFWSAAEDHDQAEARRVTVLGGDGLPLRLDAGLPDDGRMLSHVRARDGAAVLAQLDGVLPQGPGRDDVRGAVAPFASEGFSDAFAREMLALLGRFGLVVVEPATLRRFAAPVVRREIERPGELAGRIAAAEAELVRVTGVGPPLALPRPELFFAVEDGVRHRVAWDGAAWRQGDRGASAADLLARLDADPGAFSWNVASRVLAQDVALPVAAHVCGPAEFAYASVLGSAHRALGVAPPALLPRTGVTLVEARIRAFAQDLGTTPERVIVGDLPASAAGGASGVPDVSALRRGLAELPEGRSPAARRRRADLLRGLDLYAAAMEQEAGAAEATTAARRRRVVEALRPSGGLQERTLSFLPFVARHGTGVLDRILGAFDDPDAEHVVLDV